MNDYGSLAWYVAGGTILILLFGRLLWRGLHKNKGSDISPVSEQWLAERRGKHPPE